MNRRDSGKLESESSKVGSTGFNVEGDLGKEPQCRNSPLSQSRAGSCCQRRDLTLIGSADAVGTFSRPFLGALPCPAR